MRSFGYDDLGGDVSFLKLVVEVENMAFDSSRVLKRRGGDKSYFHLIQEEEARLPARQDALYPASDEELLFQEGLKVT